MSEQVERLLGLIGTEYPIIQAPMALVGTPQLAAASSNAGALGSLGCAVLTPDAFRSQVDELRALTNKPFNVNFFSHIQPQPNEERDNAFAARLSPYFEELEIDQPPGLSELFPAFNPSMLEAVREARPPIVSFHFGLPDRESVEAIQSDGAVLIGTATTVAEAKALEAQSVDIVVAQGHEAGGHSGVFDAAPNRVQIGTMALVPQVVDAVSIPVVAAGGIFDGRGVAAALALGAAGVQLGTAFVACPESAANEVYRRALANCSDDSTQLTTLLSGRPARAIVTRFIRDLADIEESTPDFPLPFSQTAMLGQASLEQESPDFLAMWAGQGAARTRPIPAVDLVAALVEEARQAGAPI